MSCHFGFWFNLPRAAQFPHESGPGGVSIIRRIQSQIVPGTLSPRSPASHAKSSQFGAQIRRKSFELEPRLRACFPAITGPDLYRGAYYTKQPKTSVSCQIFRFRFNFLLTPMTAMTQITAKNRGGKVVITTPFCTRKTI